ncbi:ROK family protein [Agromyces sp. LHK192]|uniref:ROK family protein n=1 Tax=Agromyces sp. LHK192 TaxID=2498704 RepID=UPI000FDBDF05|nr:ROK family protein [Agromyces sp. LHK192]
MLGPGPAVLAFDVGGTDTKSALVDAGGRVLGLRRTATVSDASDPAGAVVSGVARLAAAYREEFPDVTPVAAGVSVPGLVDDSTGIAVFASNLRWRDAPIRDLAAEAVGLPVAFGHDVRAAGIAERRLGAARGHANVFLVAIGTGIAAASIVDGRPLTAGGYAGELGHTLSDPNGDPCPCGAVGCLETIASASAIARRYREATGIEVAGAKEVLAAARAGDGSAQRVWDDAVEALAEQLARVAALLAPEVVVVGGGLAQAGADLLDPLAARLDGLLSFHRRPLLVPAELGDDAGVLGTALAARDAAA